MTKPADERTAKAREFLRSDMWRAAKVGSDEEIDLLAELRSSAIKEAREECVRAVCSCCAIDGAPQDRIGWSTATPAGDDGGPRFVHVYDDGSEIECEAESIRALGER